MLMHWSLGDHEVGGGFGDRLSVGSAVFYGVNEFPPGCMITYRIFKEKAQQWITDPGIQRLVNDINKHDRGRIS